MFSADEVAELRADAEQAMGAANGACDVRVRRRTGRGPLTPGGAGTSTWETVHELLPARLDGSGSSDGGSARLSVGDVTWENATGMLHLPVSTVNLADGDMVEVIAGTWLHTVVRIVAAVKADLKVERRVPVAEAARPVEWDDAP